MLVVNHSIVVVCYCSKCFLSGLIRTFLTRSHTIDQTGGWFKNKVAEAENCYSNASQQLSECEDNCGRFYWLPALPDQSPARRAASVGERERGV